MGETVQYARETPGLEFIFAHCVRDAGVQALLLACNPLRLLARRASVMFGSLPLAKNAMRSPSSTAL